MRQMSALSALAAATLAGQCLPQAQPQQFAESPAISYAFASDLGSGVYDWGGRTLQVYRLPIGWSLRETKPGSPGIRLRLPVTFGILNFKTSDLIEGELPSQFDLVTIAPGLELEFRPDEHWSIRPYMETGLSFMSTAESDARIATLGTDADHLVEVAGGEVQSSVRASFTKVDYRGCLPDDDMGRIRTGVEWRHPMPLSVAGRRFVYGVFGIGEWIFDTPQLQVPGTDFEPLQAEVGVMLGLAPMPEIRGIKLPRLGISYRFAGDFSGWRFVIGGPL